jgi:hypothetical protein
MRWIAIGCLVVVTLTGCASRNVAVVSDSEGRHAVTSDNLSHVIGADSVGPGDRLLLIRLGYQNPLKFVEEVMIGQFPASPSGRSYVDLEPKDQSGDMLVLLRLKGDAGDTAVIQNAVCPDRIKAWCWMTLPPDSPYVTIKLAPPGQVTYGGHITYRIRDQYPERGTRNMPVLEDYVLSDSYNSDMGAATTRWPVIKTFGPKKSLGVVKRGQSPIVEGLTRKK